MIDKNEIRCGNWFRHNESWCYRDNTEPFYFQWEDRDWYALGECTLSLEDCDPIPLSEEVLVKCGFKKDGDFYLHPSTMIFELTQKFPEFGYWWAVRRTSLPAAIVIKERFSYLHELMNLFYSLTKEELVYNP